MQVLGVGVDLVKISRISDILRKNYKLRFLTKVLHPKELEHFQTITSEEYQGQFVASRWAAKEATVKAIGKRELVFAETHITKDLNGTWATIQESLSWR
jgi:phosphopantetheine--protein transferase-like protein